MDTTHLQERVRATMAKIMWETNGKYEHVFAL